MYRIDFLENEVHSLNEALSELRKYIYNEHQHQGVLKNSEAINAPLLFVAACKLQFKIAKIIDPTTTVILQDFLNFGTDGLSN